MNDAKNALAALRAKKAPEPVAPPAATPASPAPEPAPATCPECNGRCCRDQDFGHRVEHMGAECYEHWCDYCQDGDTYVAPLGLYLLTQNVNRGYGTYDSCIVAAESAEAARFIHPAGEGFEYRGRWGRQHPSGYWFDDRAWAPPEDVIATRIGTANPSIKAGTVVRASFNAG